MFAAGVIFRYRRTDTRSVEASLDVTQSLRKRKKSKTPIFMKGKNSFLLPHRLTTNDFVMRFKRLLQVASGEQQKAFHALPPDLCEAPRSDQALLQNLEKMSVALKEKDRRIAQLLQYEYSAKKALEQKTWQQEALENERAKTASLIKEQETLASVLDESRQHAQQLERAVQFLQKRAEEVLLEKHQLHENNIDAFETIARLNGENETYQHQNALLTKQLAKFQEAEGELQLELSTLYQQFDGLKRLLENEKTHTATLSGNLEQSQATAELLHGEKELLQEALRSYQEEISTIKHHLTKGLRDSKELENKYSEAVTEKILSLKSLYQLQREFDKQHQENLELKERLRTSFVREKEGKGTLEQKLALMSHQFFACDEQLKKCAREKESLAEQMEILMLKNEVLLNERDGLHESVNHLQKEIEILHTQQRQVLDRLENATHSNASLESQNEQLRQEVEAHQAYCEEKQLQLEEAQQHLAKKVRESALLVEKIEELTLQADENVSVYATLQQANSLLQSDLQKMENEKKELGEQIAFLQSEIKREEARWHATDKRRQLAEEKVANLEKIEQRHAQLQNLLSGLGNVLGGANNEIVPGADAKQYQMRLGPQFGDSIDEESPVLKNEADDSVKPYANLFDVTQGTGTSRPKQTLFD